MKHLQRKLLIILIVSLNISCSKDQLCNNYPCNTNSLTVKTFSDIKYRKGTWLNVTSYYDKAPYQDTIEFENDTIWSRWGFNPFTHIKSGFYHKKYQMPKPFATGNTGSIRNFANFLNQSTTDYRTYDWYYDTAKSFVYFDFNRDFRSSSEPVVYSRFIKIQ